MLLEAQNTVRKLNNSIHSQLLTPRELTLSKLTWSPLVSSKHVERKRRLILKLSF